MASYLLNRLLSPSSPSSSSSKTTTSAKSQRIVVLISGSGTNLQALIDAGLPVVHVLSNRKAAYGLTRARNAGIASSYHNLTPYKAAHPGDDRAAREAYDADLADLILAQNPDLVVCAGWMHILSLAALDPLASAGVDIINLHPALPGCFDGKDAIRRAWEAFNAGKITETGVMIHHVIGPVDRGEPIVIKKVDLRAGESLEDLEARMRVVEHAAIVEGTRIVLDKRAERDAAQKA